MTRRESRVRHPGQRTSATRDVDDSGCRCLSQQWQHRLVDSKGAEDVRLPNPAHLLQRYGARTVQSGVVLDGLSGQLTRIRDRSIVHEHVEPSKLLADPLSRGGDRNLIRHVELKGVGVWPNLPGRGLAALEIARPNQHSKAMRHEVFCDLKTYSLIRSGD